MYVVIKACDLILHLKLTAMIAIEMVSCCKHWTQPTSQEKGLLNAKGKKIPTKGRSRDNLDPGTVAQAPVSQTNMTLCFDVVSIYKRVLGDQKTAILPLLSHHETYIGTSLPVPDCHQPAQSHY